MLKAQFTSYVFPITVGIAVVALVGLFLVGPFTIEKNLATVVGSLASTFLGGAFAFELNKYKERQKTYDDRLSAIKFSQFLLSQQQQALEDVWGKISAWESKADRSLNMPKMHLPDYSRFRQDFTALSFVMDDEPELLLALSIEDDRFSQAIAVVRHLGDQYTNHILPVYEAKSVPGKQYTYEERKEMLGQQTFNSAKSITDNVFVHFQSTRRSIFEMHQKIADYRKKHFPKEKFWRIEPGGIPSLASESQAANPAKAK